MGFAERDITPPEGFPVAGYYHERRATGTHDPLKAKAIVFHQGETRAAWVVCDLTGISIDLSSAVREDASRATGIPWEQITVSATHSHTAPDYGRDLFAHTADRAGVSQGDGAYSRSLIASIVDAIRAANDQTAPVTLESATAIQQDPVSFNRRFVMRDGSVRTWQRLDNPDVVRPAGPIDPELAVLVARRASDGRPIGALVNFALHLDTVGGTMWSADYPYPIERAVRSALGDDVVSVFGTGCCGDINHSDPTRADRNSTEHIGTSLGRTVTEAVGRSQPIASPRLNVGRAVVPLPLQEVTDSQLAAARPLLLSAKDGAKVDFFEQVAAYKAVMLEQLRNERPSADPTAFINWGLCRKWAGVGDHLPVEVQTLCLGSDLAIVGLPGEIFVELGLAIKRASPFRTTIVIELSNCVETIYVPTRAAYAGGSYEVLNSATAPGSGEMLVEAALKLLRDAATEGNAP
ncbi:MAG: hypothetical protein FJ297_02335 [Planctomycetes bacterium]|nr:hypothetical protein [Planctomycetota bacterium]